MRSWSPPTHRGLEKRGSADGYVYKGRFRIRDLSFSESGPPSIASEYSTCSAPAAGEAINPAGNVAPTRSSAAIATIGDSSSVTVGTDGHSNASDYSFCRAVSEISENDICGTPDKSVREKEARCQRRHGEVTARLRTRSEEGDRNGEGSPRGRESSISMGETSETSGGYESEQGKMMLVSSLDEPACTSPYRVAQGLKGRRRRMQARQSVDSLLRSELGQDP